jgi:replication factor C subunit 2/4
MEYKKNHSWVEKYRPQKLDDITAQHEVLCALKKTLLTKNLPHLIFYGPSGCGKTSTILALAKELFGEKYYNDRVIELNASDERGINTIREKIKTYAKKAINPNDNIPPWKLIILDEADNMTSDSQSALRRIMEDFSKITRFCIICNYHNKIIDPINSRCALFRFTPISEDNIIIKLKNICQKENIKCSDIVLEKIKTESKGDLRKAINFLQKCHMSYGNELNLDIITEISGKISDNTFNELIETIINEDSIKMNKLINQITNDGFSLVNQLKLFFDFVKDEQKLYNILKNKLKDENNLDLIVSQIKSKLVIKISEIDYNLLKGGDEYIEFMHLAYNFSKIINNF